MTYHAFRQLSPRAQLIVVLTDGTYLVRRWDKEIGAVNLYHLSDIGCGFFAEVGIAEKQDYFAILGSFRCNDALEKYACYVQLPSDLLY